MSNLPVEKQAEPVYGWKVLNLGYHRPYWEFTSLYDNSEVAVVKAVAECNKRAHTRIPDEFCTCGFYAMYSHKSLVDQPTWLCRVRMYGRVIVAKNGFRGQYQDILEVWAPNDSTVDEDAIRAQWPGIIWHFSKPKPKPVEANPQHVYVTVSHSANDVLPKEFIDSLVPGSSYMHMLPICKNASMTPTLHVYVTNTGLRFEMRDAFGSIIFNQHFEGSKEWYPQPDK